MDLAKFWDNASAGLYTLVGGVIVAVIGFFVQRRKQTLDADGSIRADLSKSERDFRIDILAQLNDMRAQLAECQDHRNETIEANTELRIEIQALRERVRTLTQRVTGEDAMPYRTDDSEV